MCSVLGILEITSDHDELRDEALKLSRLMQHRGPDWSGVYAGDRAILAHERLSIVDVEHGAQPLFGENRKTVLAVNGEIYNHVGLRSRIENPYEFQTASDCEIILPLYRDYGVKFIDELRGMFAFVLYDEDEDAYLIARDHQGIIPLYWGRDDKGRVWVASEMKALVPVCKTFDTFPPGHYFYSGDEGDEPVRYWTRDWFEYDNVKDNPASHEAIRDALEESTHCHLMSDVPYGVLLSGGLDSSITAAVAAKYAENRIEDDDKSKAWWPRLHSFAIGLEGSPDLAAAKQVAAKGIGTVHHELTYTIQDGLDALRDVIWHLETYDVTTIRASTPMILMARRIKAMGIKMVLSGEGADEIFGGYLYFHKAPTRDSEFHDETVRKLDELRQVRLPARQQVDGRVGRRGARAVPRPRVRRRGDEIFDPEAKMCQGRPDREADPARSVRAPAARGDLVAAEGAVLRRRWLRLDRHPQGGRRVQGLRRGPRRRAVPIPDQSAGHQGRLLLPHHLRGALPRRGRGQDRPRRQVRRLLDAGRDRVGRGLQEHGRPVWSCGERPQRRVLSGSTALRRLAEGARPLCAASRQFAAA